MTGRRVIVLALCAIVLASGLASGKRVLFYEKDVPKEYTKDNGYSKLRDKLVSMGYDIAAITHGSLTRSTIEAYDVMIIHASQQLSTDEMATIVWFVSSKGGGILVAGGTPEHANRLMPIFGMTMDDGTLIDFTNSIEVEGTTRRKKTKENSEFVVTRFSVDNITRYLRLGVNTIGFYEGHGLILSSDARWVARGDSDTYSDTQSFPSGSEPPVVAASLFGNGLAVGLGDADMISNDHIEEYDNRVFVANIVEWLSTSKAPVSRNASEVEMEVVINTLNLERIRLASDVDNLKTKVDGLEAGNQLLNDDFLTCTTELDDIKSGKIGPFTRNQLAIVVAGLFVLVGGALFSKRGGGVGKTESVKEGDDILSELGYEFEEEGGAGEGGGAGEEGGSGDELTDDVDKL